VRERESEREKVREKVRERERSGECVDVECESKINGERELRLRGGFSFASMLAEEAPCDAPCARFNRGGACIGRSRRETPFDFGTGRKSADVVRIPPGTDAMIFKVFSPKNLAEKLAFF
jgi:hypothetical protein